MRYRRMEKAITANKDGATPWEVTSDVEILPDSEGFQVWFGNGVDFVPVRCKLRGPLNAFFTAINLYDDLRAETAALREATTCNGMHRGMTCQECHLDDSMRVAALKELLKKVQEENDRMREAFRVLKEASKAVIPSISTAQLSWLNRKKELEEALILTDEFKLQGEQGEAK